METIKGVPETVYSNKKHEETVVKEKPIKVNKAMGIKVRHRETGEIYRSINFLAMKLGVTQMWLQRKLEKDLASFEYELYKEKILGDESI